MIEKTVLIKNQTGLHARPASKFVQEASRYQSDITITKANRTVNAKSIISVLSLGANQGAEIKICISGEDESLAMAGLVSFLETLAREAG